MKYMMTTRESLVPEGRSTLKNGAWLSPLNTANAFLFTNALFPGKETVNALILV